jgi:hypothetical protein
MCLTINAIPVFKSPGFTTPFAKGDNPSESFPPPDKIEQRLFESVENTM